MNHLLLHCSIIRELCDFLLCLVGLVGVSVLQTHYNTPFFIIFSLGHSFISPTSDFRKTKRKYEEKAF